MVDAGGNGQTFESRNFRIYCVHTYLVRTAKGTLMPPKSERFELRLDEDILSRIDKWRAQQDDLPARAEAMRRLVESALARTSPETVRLTDGEKLILSMLCDISKHLEIGDEEGPDFIAQTLYGGHFWALKWQLSGLLHEHEDDPQNVTLVVDILEMWNFIERGYGALTRKEKALVEKDAAPFGRNPQFPGFDGNNEGELFGIGLFLVKQMGRFARFKDRDLNSHRQVLAMYQRMLRVFRPIKAALTGDDLNAAQITAILKAMNWEK